MADSGHQETLPIQSLRAERMKRVQTVQHVFGAMLLISNGWSHIKHAGAEVLPVLEVLSGAVLIFAAIRERFHKGHSRVGWVELAGSAMMFVEAIHRLGERHHLLLYILWFIPPVMLALFGIFDVRMQQLPKMIATDDHLKMRIRLLGLRRIRWSDFSAFRFTPKAIELQAESGKTKRLPLRHVKNRDEVVAWVREQCLRRGLVER